MSRPINYWLTFTEKDNKFHERIAVLATLELSDDNLSGKCSIPHLGILVENDSRALKVAHERAASKLSAVFGSGELRSGIITQATFFETRDALFASEGSTVFTAEEYEEADRDFFEKSGSGLDLPLIY